MRIAEVIADWLITTKFLENAYQRADAETRITSTGNEVVEHLTKILKWDDPINRPKHEKDINGWLYAIQRIKLKTKHKKPTANDYYQWILLDNAEDETEFDTIILSLHGYHGLPDLRSNYEVYNIIKGIIYNVSNEMEFNQFKGIESHLKNY